MPQVSVVMPVWNGKRHLEQAISSVLRQTFQDLELVVVDDGSTDGTLELLRSYRDPRLRILPLEHQGIVHALNQGVAEAKAELIARADSDDICAPTRLAQQISLLRAHPEAVLCYSDVEYFGDLRLVPTRSPWLPRSRGLLAMRMCAFCPIVHSTVLFKRKAFHEAGGYRPEERHAEDFGLWGRLIELGAFVSVPRKLVQFRVHEQSISKQKSEAQRKVAQIIAISHCRQFMGLSDDLAGRVFRILMASPEQRSLSSWFWFLSHGAVRLRWKSPELLAWLAKESCRVVYGQLKAAGRN